MHFPVRKMDTDIDCGITAIQQIAQYFGRSVTKSQIAKLTGFDHIHNLTDTPGHLIRGLNALNIPFALVQAKLTNGIVNTPCIVLKQYGFSQYHYEVYFAENNQAWVSDGDGVKPVDFAKEQHQPRGFINHILQTSNLIFICGVEGKNDKELTKYHLGLSKFCDCLVKISIKI